MLAKVFAVFHLLASLSMCSSEPSDLQTLNALGRREALVIEGCKTFTPDEIRNAVLNDSIVGQRRAPTESLAGYLEVLKSRVTQGYMEAGFDSATVTVERDLNANRIVIKISEGERFKLGDVHIKGASTIDVAALRRRITAERATGRDEFIQNLAARETVKPIWKIGDVPDFGIDCLTEAKKQILSDLQLLGYPCARIQVAIEKERSKGELVLKVDILEEGARSIGRIEVKGNVRNTREEFLSYLHLSVGQPFQENVCAALTSKLWESGRFLEQTVTISPPLGPGGAAGLRIEVVENPNVATLSQPLPEFQALAAKFARDISLIETEQVDTTVFYRSENGIQSELVFSPTQGAIVRLHSAKVAAEPKHLATFLCGADRCLVTFGESAKHLGIPKSKVVPSIILVTTLRARLNKDPKLDPEISLENGFQIYSDQTGAPIIPRLCVSPAALICHVARAGASVKLENGVLSGTDKDQSFRLDIARSEIDVNIHKSDSGKCSMKLSKSRGRFDSLCQSCFRASRGGENRFDAVRPWESSLEYFAEEYGSISKELSIYWKLKRTPSTATLGKQARLIGQFLDQRKGSSLAEIFSPRFRLSARNEHAQALATLGLAYQFSDLFDYGSWQWTMIREFANAYVARGGHIAEIRRIAEQSNNGPICLLALARLLEFGKHPMAANIALGGITKLTREEFRQECASFVNGHSEFQRWIVPLIGCMQSGDDGFSCFLESIDTSKGISEAKSATVNELTKFLTLLRKKEGQEPLAALVELLDEAWPLCIEKVMRDDFERIIRDQNRMAQQPQNSQRR